MNVRLYCHVTPPGDFWGDLGHAYFLALRQVADVIRVVPSQMLLRQPGVNVATGRWAAHPEAFTAELPAQFVHVVCGDDGPLGHLYTVGVSNVAITAVRSPRPTPYETAALARYALVVCSTLEDAALLGNEGVPALCVPPDPDALGRLLDGLVDIGD